MSLDRRLKMHGGLKGARSVLTRPERIAKMIDEGKFNPETDSPLGLPKLRVHHSKAGAKSKKAEAPVEGVEGEEGAEAVEGAETAPSTDKS